jgi:hypothetical protein
MPTIADVADAELRAALASAEASLDSGDNNGAVQTVVEVYRRAVARRPELIVPFVDRRGQFPKPGEGLANVRGPYGPPWPDLGIGLTRVDDQPVFEFRKQRFSMSEAIVYFEYVLDLVVRAEATS